MEATAWLLLSIGVAVAVLAVDRVVAHWGGVVAHRGGVVADRGAVGGRPKPKSRSAWERRRAGASGFIGDLIEVFQPSHHHLVAEQERRRGEIRQTGSAAPGLDIDLEGGVATFPRGRRTDLGAADSDRKP